MIKIKTPAGVFVDDSMTEPPALALHAFALFVGEVGKPMATVPVSADMGPVKSAVRLTFDAMPTGTACEVDRLAIIITLKFGGDVVEVSA